jgi:nucleoside-diphosphate-sugar epimerase
MRIFVAGATGSIGRPLVALLVRRGHEVIGSTRHPERQGEIRQAGASSVVMDGLDGASVKQAVTRAQPDVVVHQLTAIPPDASIKHFDDAFATTNRLRTEGTDHLLEAARSAGARRFVAQSYAAWPYERSGAAVKSEGDPLDPDPPAEQQRTLAAIRYQESVVLDDPDLEGVALRYGAFTGPGTPFGEGGMVREAVRRRRFPLVGSGDGIWSFVHVDDAAEATALASERGRGIYNVVDDHPAPVRAWLPGLAEITAAKPPRHVPTWLARMMIGDVGVSLMTRIRGASNAKIKRELGWQPRHAGWRAGFLAASPS